LKLVLTFSNGKASMDAFATYLRMINNASEGSGEIERDWAEGD